jgi:hypothetical protein
MPAVAMPDTHADLLAATALSIGESGPSLTGRQRVAIAAAARASMSGATPETLATEAMDELVRRLSVEAHTIRQDWIAELAAEGIDAYTYVEVLGIVARLSALDTFCFGLDADLVDLPVGSDDPPTGRVAREAAIEGGWVPTVGRAFPPTALTAVPSEHDAWEDVHNVLYLSMAEMRDLDVNKGLHRTQMELVAARTSLLNDCFF